ncbi:MAG TPA: DoxX family protein [Longimicrobiaceae bacterium]
METTLSRPHTAARTAPQTTPAAPVSRGKLRTGRALSTLVVLFLLMDSGVKLVQAAPAVEATAQLGYPGSTVLPLGLLLLACTVLYVVPRTAVLGAVLLTGYLGGAVASHVRVENPLFSHTLFPVYLGVLLWGGLDLRDARVRALLPLR